jgi:hypothetical protein
MRASVTASVAGDFEAPLPACGVEGPRMTSDSAVFGLGAGPDLEADWYAEQFP